MESIIKQVHETIKKKMMHEFSGHDYWHVIRVYNNALLIMEKEKKDNKLDEQVIQLASLLHDIGDYKITGKEETATEIPKQILEALSVDKKTIDKVIMIIGEISFHQQIKTLSSIESMIVQDADRLDALGAVGIARTFAYGGAKYRDIWDPNTPPVLNMKKEEYIKNQGSSINHFYEKLLLLKDKMNTDTGKKIAEKRHAYMEGYLEQFFAEWKGLR